jgi:hypothetical protein
MFGWPMVATVLLKLLYVFEGIFFVTFRGKKTG